MKRAAVVLVSLLTLVAVSCGDGSESPSPTIPIGQTAMPKVASTSAAPLVAGLTNAATYQDIPTYDGSGQTVHPDIAYFPDGWHGYKYWMAMTPNYYDSAGRENPHVVASNDGLSWEVPPGLANPVVPFPPCDHNSDPDIVYNPRSDELYLYYTEQRRAEYCGTTNENRLVLLMSSDGVDWGESHALITWDVAKEPLYVSPAVVYRDGQFELWLTTGTEVVHATSEDGVNWSPLEPASIDAVPWHLDVAYVKDRSEYWMLFVDSPVAGSKLRLATSKDGLNWTAQLDPVLSPGSGWDGERIYRSTFLYDAGGIFRVWYSAKDSAGRWHVGYAERAIK
jgi:hypothetical protein